MLWGVRAVALCVERLSGNLRVIGLLPVLPVHVCVEVSLSKTLETNYVTATPLGFRQKRQVLDVNLTVKAQMLI